MAAFIPCFFDSASKLYGVFHPADKPGSLAALIVPPFGQDYVRCHKSLQKLAIDLARRGVSTLRFDLSGSGNSSDADGLSLSLWSEDTRAAMAELTARSGCEQIAVVGVRLGAAIAASVETQVEQMIFWDPVFDGGGYLAELDQLHQVVTQSPLYVDPSRRSPVAAPTERAGYWMPDTLRQSMHNFSLADPVPLRASRALWLNAESTGCHQGFTKFQQSTDADCLYRELNMPCYWRCVEQLENMLMGQPAAREILSFIVDGDGSGTRNSIRT